MRSLSTFCIVLLLGFTHANYFLYGHIEWQRINTGNSSQYVVEFSLKLGIKDYNLDKALGMTYDFEGNVFQFGDGTSSNLSSSIVQYISPRLPGDYPWFFTNPVRRHEYSGPGPHFAMVESGPFARDATLRNNDLKQFRLRCKVDMSNNNNYSPTITEPIDQKFYWNQTDVVLVKYDRDGDAVTFRLATSYELGDPLNPTTTGANSQQQENPYLLTVDPITGQILWTQAQYLQSGRYQLQVMFSDGLGEVPLDFILDNTNVFNDRPVIGGGFTPNASAPEEFLIDQPILFNISACDPSNLMGSIAAVETFNVMPTVGVMVTTLGPRCGTQAFNYTPREAGPSRHCFYAYDNLGMASQIYCFTFTIVPRPLVDTVWQAPTKQKTGWPLEAWFTGSYLSAADRVATIPDSQDCANLDPNAGVQVTFVELPVSRVAIGPRLNYRRALAELVAGVPGMTKWCYRLNAATGYTSPALAWQLVRYTPPPFEVTTDGPYRITTLVGCPLYNRPFRYIIEGNNLVRFDRVYFLVPSQLPPNNSTINCEDLADTDGKMINNVPVLEGTQPGFVAGGERAEFPWNHSVSDLGQYMCYKPFQKPWRMIKYIKPLSWEGVYGVLGTKTVGQDAVNITVAGVNLTSTDRWAAYPYRVGEDCSSMLRVNGNATDVFAPGAGATNAPSFTVTGNTYPGINLLSLCYQRNGAPCKIADINLKDQVYSYTSIPDPVSTTQQYPFVDFTPYSAMVNESMIYEFTGYEPYGYILNDPCYPTAEDTKACRACKGFQVKVAEHSSCAGVARGGDPQYLTKDRRAIFRLQDVGFFRFCVKHRVDWEPVARQLQIKPVPALTNSSAFYGYVNCKAYLSEYAPAACGCFLGGYPGEFINVPVTHPVSAGLSTSLNFNQGCCAYPSANRTTVGADVKAGVARPWGQCFYQAVKVPVPYPPFEVPNDPSRV